MLAACTEVVLTPESLRRRSIRTSTRATSTAGPKSTAPAVSVASSEPDRRKPLPGPLTRLCSTGVGPTFFGYSIQGACKYGFYELFKKK